jgi:hypothetical protein
MRHTDILKPEGFDQLNNSGEARFLKISRIPNALFNDFLRNRSAVV